MIGIITKKTVFFSFMLFFVMNLFGAAGPKEEAQMDQEAVEELMMNLLSTQGLKDDELMLAQLFDYKVSEDPATKKAYLALLYNIMAEMPMEKDDAEKLIEMGLVGENNYKVLPEIEELVKKHLATLWVNPFAEAPKTVAKKPAGAAAR